MSVDRRRRGISLGFAPRPSTRSERPDKSLARMRAPVGLRVAEAGYVSTFRGDTAAGGGLRFNVSWRHGCGRLDLLGELVQWLSG